MNGWQPAPVGSGASGQTRPAWWVELVVAVAAAAVVAVLGAPLGLIWLAIAPRVELVRESDGWHTVGTETEQFIADDGWFFIISLVVGLLLAVGGWLVLRRFRGPAVLSALAVGSVAASVIAAWLGHRVGVGDFPRQFKEAAVGTHLHSPPELRTIDVGLWFGFIPRVRGVALVQAAAAVAGYTLLAAFHYAPSLQPEDFDDTEDDGSGDPTWAADWGGNGPGVGDAGSANVSSGWSAPIGPTVAPGWPAPSPTDQPHDAAGPAQPTTG